MKEFKYRGEKAILITSDDFVANRRFSVEVLTSDKYWKDLLADLKQNKKVKHIFLVTSLPLLSFPKCIRIVLQRRKNCYVGSI